MKTALSKPTHVEAVRDRAFNQMLMICNCLGWNEAYYSEHQLKEYELFLKRYFCGKPEAILNAVKYSPIMAGLWKNEWIVRNRTEFIPFASEMCTESMHVNELGYFVHYVPSDTDYARVYDEYCWLHSAIRLLNDVNFMRQAIYAINLITRE